MALKEIQEKTRIFKASDDVLCIGLSPDDVDYLGSIKVDIITTDGLEHYKELISLCQNTFIANIKTQKKNSCYVCRTYKSHLDIQGIVDV